MMSVFDFPSIDGFMLLKSLPILKRAEIFAHPHRAGGKTTRTDFFVWHVEFFIKGRVEE